jgi:hypothetical protein
MNQTASSQEIATMSQLPQSLTTQQITAYIDRVNNGGLPQVLQVYDEL